MRRFLLALMTGVTLASCGGDDPTGLNGSSIYGTYQLQTIGGESLPCCRSANMSRDGYVETEIEGGTWSLRDDDSWSATWEVHTTIFDPVVGSQVEDVTTTFPFGTGSYAKTNNDLLFTRSDGLTYNGSVAGPVLTVIVDENLPVVYRK